MFNLKMIRLNKNLSQKEVGEKSGISESFYCLIENGERQPSVTTAKKIANVLEFEWTKFFDKAE